MRIYKVALLWHSRTVWTVEHHPEPGILLPPEEDSKGIDALLTPTHSESLSLPTPPPTRFVEIISKETRNKAETMTVLGVLFCFFAQDTLTSEY